MCDKLTYQQGYSSWSLEVEESLDSSLLDFQQEDEVRELSLCFVIIAEKSSFQNDPDAYCP